MNVLWSLLETAADSWPERLAVDATERTLTYGELGVESERLAARLAADGVGPGVRVGFRFRKSADALVALFAVLGTDATCVPMGPDWPAEHVAALARHAGVDAWVGADAPAGRSPRRPPDPEATPVAMMFATSGSSGKPKVVKVTAAGLLHYARWGVRHFGLGPEDRIANHPPYHYAFSTFDIFGAVAAGATMCPVPDGPRVLANDTAAFIAAKRVTWWASVPSAFAATIERGGLGGRDVSALRWVVFAGEPMPPAIARQLWRAMPGTQLVNSYGTTETNGCLFHVLARGDLAADVIPAGVPTEGTRAWVVGDAALPVTDGTAGELWIAGPTVTPGYVAAPSLTAERLVPAPDGQGSAFRTRDRARRDQAGRFTVLGRLDRAFSSRGHTVEPGAIERVLRAHPDVHEAAVVPVADARVGNRIKAVVAGPAGGPAAAELRRFCRTRLPSHLVPQSWEVRDQLPRTSRGKIDSSQLGS